MATTKTRRELVDAALDSLGILTPGQAPSDEDVGRVDDLLDPVLEMQAALGVVYVSDPGTSSPPSGGQIELSVFLPLADIVAWNVAPAFNLQGDASLKVLADEAEKVLRRINRPARTRKLLRTDAQLSNRNTRGVVYNPLTGE